MLIRTPDKPHFATIIYRCDKSMDQHRLIFFLNSFQKIFMQSFDNFFRYFQFVFTEN